MAKYQIKEGSVAIFPWEVDPEWVEDGWVTRMQNLVGAEVQTEDGTFLRLFHRHAFVNDPEGAQRLADRVAARGQIDSEYWGSHGFLSMSLEDRLAEEYLAQEYVRLGLGRSYDGPCAGGHD